MQNFQMILNNMLIQVYHNILRVEEKFLQTNNRINLTIREMHLIECVGENRDNGKTISEIAEFLKLTKPSVTVAVSKLTKKGYLRKNSCQTDGRIVRVTLTREGRKVYTYHKRYHMSMVHEIEKDFSEVERDMLVRIITKLNEFFEKSVGAET
jgi:DNA-binding MarR family transcriptional regulator